MKTLVSTLLFALLPSLLAADTPVFHGVGSNIAIEKNGMVLTPLNACKLVNVELGPKDFLELKVPLFAYTTKAEYKIQEADVVRLRNLSDALQRLAAAPASMLVQERQMQELRRVSTELNSLMKDLALRIDPNTLKP